MMPDNVFVILAGGFSRRYQDKNNQFIDKALLSINDVPVLIDLLKRGFQFYDEVSISVNSIDRKKKYSQILKLEENQPSKIIIDKTMTLKGALKGIVSTIREYQDKNIQFLSVDRPFIDFNLLNKMTIQENSISLLQYENGLLEPLLALYGSRLYFPKEIEQLQLSRADVLIRICPLVRLYCIDRIVEINQLPSEIFANINIQSDLSIEKPFYDSATLELPKPRLIRRKDLPKLDFDLLEQGFKEQIHELIENEHYYLAVLLSMYAKQNSIFNLEDFQNLACIALENEYKYWLKNDMAFLALHALQDQIIFCTQLDNRGKLKEILKLKEKMKIKSRNL